jgi:uncharacterized protein YkwD
VSSTPTIINRRWFLKVGAAFALMPAATSGQVPIERGRFSDDYLPLARQQLLDLVNTERSQTGLSTLELDDLACKVANDHARDMAQGRFLSHWGSDGRKPYHRYSFAGGIDAIQENVSAADNILSLTPNGVVGDLVDMHTAMHAEKPPNDGHRRAILASQHTHVGFGIALSGHSLRLSELYVSRYLEIKPFPQKAKRRTTVVLTGKFLNPAHFLHEVDVFFEPLPTPPAVDWLRTPRGYALPEEYVGLRPQAPHGAHYGDGSTGDYEWGSNGKFRVPAKLSRDLPGIYTIVFWIRRVPADKAFAGAEICIWAE